MRIDKFKVKEEFYGEDSEKLSIIYDNRGDPYSEGITLELCQSTFDHIFVYLEKQEAKRLAKLIADLYN